MGKTTGIAWCDSTWSPWIGCTKVSPGCEHCYAEALDALYRWGGAVHWGPGVPRHRTSAHYWRQPRIWDRVAHDHGGVHRVFPSLCDPFDNEVLAEWRSDFFALVSETPHLTWLLLTKRIGNVGTMLPVWWPDPEAWSPIRPGGNVWIGASIVNQEEADRDIPKLLAVGDVARRFVSYEPALGAVSFDRWLWDEVRDAEGGFRPTRVLHQIIVGGESAQGGQPARPFYLDWARSTMLQCRAAGVAFFMKQAGSNPHVAVDTCSLERAIREGGYRLKDRAGANPAEWPEDLRVQEFPA